MVINNFYLKIIKGKTDIIKCGHKRENPLNVLFSKEKKTENS